MAPGPGALYLVATPIGNLEDVSARALRVLGEVAFVVCEDTRRSRILLDRHGLHPPLVSLPAFAEGERLGPILDRLEGGEDAALVTDAGTPAISDPGELLVAEAIRRGVRVVPVPGPSAAVAALSASGLPSRRFHFCGFLPRKGPERQALLEELAPLRATLIFYEAPGRLAETLEDLAGALGEDRRACVARELTKVHEELVRGALGGLRDRYLGREVLGEVVVLVEGRVGEARWTEAEVRRALEDGLSAGEKLKALSTQIARRAGWSGQDVYRLGLSLKGR
ncbi:MAG TPA: 16S rRNA (cytidine(1402)-2'-O)-methyltransferase [Myxococcales bacterium]|nr:16S rRNA (cytidine(1402)-2'-O)-methyltransferase [Myxococcales bacterium]